MPGEEDRREGNPIENVERGNAREDTQPEVEQIREKQARGETLSREEAGKLGGAARAGSEKEKSA